MRFCPLASGSSGNSIYVGSECTHLLVDAGVSCKKIEDGLKTLDLSPKDLNGILITHEHSDHIAGLRVISKKYQIPIYATQGTIDAIRKDKNGSQIDPELFQSIEADQKVWISDMNFKPIRISHDAAQPVGYRISYGSKRVAVCTDLGTYNDYTVECLKGLDAVLLEANHDVRMLQLGPYPYYLKQRILGNRGHLSNENSGKLLSAVLHDNVKAILLGHLSKENNLPDLAYEAVRMEITMGENPYRADDFHITVAKRDEPSEVVVL